MPTNINFEVMPGSDTIFKLRVWDTQSIYTNAAQFNCKEIRKQEWVNETEEDDMIDVCNWKFLEEKTIENYGSQHYHEFEIDLIKPNGQKIFSL